MAETKEPTEKQNAEPGQPGGRNDVIKRVNLDYDLDLKTSAAIVAGILERQQETKPAEWEMIGGRYWRMQHLGHGGMGSVDLALDTTNGRMVAVKTITRDRLNNPQITGRFEREIEALAEIDSPFVVKPIDVVNLKKEDSVQKEPENLEETIKSEKERSQALDETVTIPLSTPDGELLEHEESPEYEGTALVMEYFDEPNLREVLNEKEQLTTSEVAGIAIQILLALHHAHEKGIMHRDLKPSNVFYLQRSSSKMVKVADFGLSALIGSSEEERSESLSMLRNPVTRTSLATSFSSPETFMGTPEYIPPERFLGKKTDERSDLYSVGVMLYELLAGKPPFPKSEYSTQLSMAIAHTTRRPEYFWMLEDKPVERENWAYGTDGPLDSIIFNLLEKKPDDRYGSALEAAIRIKQEMIEYDKKEQENLQYQIDGIKKVMGSANEEARKPLDRKIKELQEKIVKLKNASTGYPYYFVPDEIPKELAEKEPTPQEPAQFTSVSLPLHPAIEAIPVDPTGDTWSDDMIQKWFAEGEKIGKQRKEKTTKKEEAGKKIDENDKETEEVVQQDEKHGTAKPQKG